ncbi:MAG: copper-containing nitrite reductase [bacterium]
MVSKQNIWLVFGGLMAVLIVLSLVLLINNAWTGVRSDDVITAPLTFAPEVPAPITRNRPARVIVNLEAIEKRGELADGVTYEFWTFNGHVPGPFVRLRVGDTIEMHLKNNPNNTHTHTVDFHYVTGPGGGSKVLMTDPGKESVAVFKALHPGLFIYHCAANPIPAHISSGLYGLVLVEPEHGLPKVDNEYYVMQSEFYTDGEVGEKGFQAYSSRKGMAETPEYVVFNGRVGSLMGEGALQARVGDRVRLFVGNIGPNLVSSFHVIGELFDSLYREGAVTGPSREVQTTLIPAGSASWMELKVEVPGDYLLVDHSIYRIDRGAVGILHVEGTEHPEIYARK